MDDPLPYPDTDDDTGVGPDRGSTTGPPRWVKLFAIIALVLVLLFVILLLAGGGSHGPGRHTASGDAGGQAATARVTESDGVGGRQPPARGHAP